MRNVHVLIQMSEPEKIGSEIKVQKSEQSFDPSKAQAAHAEYGGQLEAEEEAIRHDIQHNASARIRNPLAGIPREMLERQVEGFVRDKSLEDISDDLRRGAILAQNPAEFETLDVLTEEERDAVRYEITHKWRQPKALYFTIILCSIGACVQGWDQTGSNGANLSFPIEFGIDNTDPTNPDYDKNNWIVGLVNSAPYISAALLSTWLTDPVNYFFGRKGSIFIAAVFCLLAPIGSAFCQNWYQLFICRLLLGFGVGFKEVTAPVFAAENAPAIIRGALVMSWQMWTAFGIFLGTTANLALFKVGKIAWRLQLGSALLPAIPLLILIPFCPESPRWLMKKNRYRDAYKSLLRLRRHKIQAARDLYYIHRQLFEEEASIGNASYVKRFFELFTVPRLRRASLAAWVVMIAQQMCGINIISFFSSSIFTEANASELSALFASWGFGLVNWVFAWPAIWTIDTFGRRTLLLFTFPNMMWSLLAAGFCFWIPESSNAHLGLIAFFIYIFAAFYSPGEGPVPFTYSAEVFPLSHRELGMAFAVATNNFFGAILSLTFFRIQAAFTVQGAFGFYAGLNAVAFVMIFLWLPETKQRTLEELDYVFGVPTHKHMQYQCTKALPYFIRRWILWDRKATLEPLYHLDHVSGAKDDKEEGPQLVG